MIIRVNGKKLVNALEDISLKGKYYNGTTGKNGQLSNFAYAETDNLNQIMIYNADHATVCKIVLEARCEFTHSSSVVFDIDKTIKYLKPFGDTTIEMHIDDYIRLVGETSTAKIPKVLDHPASAMIERFKQFQMPEEGMPTFGKTTFESKVVVLAEDLSDATKACDAVNNAKYKFDTSNNEFIMSSERNNLDKFETTVDTLTQEGECATVEFTGQFHKFMKNNATIYMKDDAPVLFVSRNRMLLKAPYLER